MPEKKFGIRDIVPNTKNSYFQMSSTMSLIPKKKKMSLIPNSVYISMYSYIHILYSIIVISEFAIRFLSVCLCVLVVCIL